MRVWVVWQGKLADDEVQLVSVLGLELAHDPGCDPAISILEVDELYELQFGVRWAERRGIATLLGNSGRSFD
jgi:hypothetical protein